jgi:multidrug transporter EmrE-like cation transporter
MESFFKFIEANYTGILLLFVGALFLVLMVHWIAWIFGLGRFKVINNQGSREGGLFYILGDLLVKIINDFRHLLALILVLIFAISLAYAFYFADNLENLSSSLQAVMSTLGTLVGSIVGYYFGESAVKKANREREEPKELANPPIQEGHGEGIKEVEMPPNL